MATAKVPDIDEFRQLVEYDASTGVFTWLRRDIANFPDELSGRIWNTRYAGRPAGTLSHGYVSVRMLGRFWLGHRLAWFLSYGSWPLHEIDHKNGIRHDNRIDNLRCVVSAEQKKNLRRAKNNTTGVTGVRFTKGRYQAEIGNGSERVYLGRYKSLAEAAAVRKQAEVKYGYHENHGR